MKNEKMLLTTKFNQIDEENFLREKQLKTEQIRIKEFQLNLKILDDHQSKSNRLNEGGRTGHSITSSFNRNGRL